MLVYFEADVIVRMTGGFLGSDLEEVMIKELNEDLLHNYLIFGTLWISLTFIMKLTFSTIFHSLTMSSFVGKFCYVC